MPIPLSQRLDQSVVDLADKYGPTAVGQDDPSQEIPGAPPNLGQSPLPHVLTFQGIASSIAKVYRPSDEAMKDSRENARFMRNDPTIMECLEMRRRSTALLNWHIEPEDEKDETAKWLAGELTDVLKKTPRFTQFRECLLDALWYGKYGVQMRYRWKTTRNGKRIVIDRWQPVNGDKLVFRYDDGSGDFDPDQVGIRVGTGFTGSDGVSQRWGDHRLSKVEATDWGMAYFLEPWERKLLAIHKHMIEDGEYEELQNAGRIHGVGIRSRIYWLWYQRQECLAWLMEFLERSAFGIEIWYYPWGSPKAREDTRKAAEERIGQGRNIILVPKPMGEDGMSYGVERIEPGMQGAEILKEILSDFFGHQIKRYILGQTLTTEAGSTGLGSNLASIHLDTYLQIIHYDAGNLDETMTEDVVQPLQEFNFPKYAHLAMRFKTETDTPDVESKLNAWREAFDMGCKLRERDVMDLIGADMPEEGEEALQDPQFKQAAMGGGMSGMPGAGGMPGMPPGAGADGGMPPGMEGEGGGQAPGSFDDGSGGGGPAAPPPPPGPEDYDANGQPIFANSDRKKLLDPEKSVEPEQYAKDPEFEKLHPRGGGGEFAEAGSTLSKPKESKPDAKPDAKPTSKSSNIQQAADLFKQAGKHSLPSKDAIDGLLGEEVNRDDATAFLEAVGLDPINAADTAYDLTEKGRTSPAALVVHAQYVLRREDRETRRKQVIEEAGDAKVIELTRPDGRKIVVSPSVYGDHVGEWQVTQWDSQGPMGHVNFGSREQALAASVGAGENSLFDEGDETYRISRKIGSIKPKEPEKDAEAKKSREPDAPFLSSENSPPPGQLFDTSEDPYESEFGTFARDPAKAAPKGKRGRKPMPGQRGLWEDFDVPEKPKRQEQQMLFRNEGERLRYMLDREMCQRGLGSPYTPEDSARLAAWFAGGQNGQVDIPDRFGSVYRYSRRYGSLSVERFAKEQPRVPAGSTEGGEFTGPGAAIKALVKESLNLPKGRRPEGFKPKTVAYREIDEAEAARIREATGLDVAGFSHCVDQYAVEHILKEHGSEEVVSGDEIPVGLEDIARIAEITSDPDEIVPAGKTHQSLDGIRYKKRVNGYIFFVEEVRKGKKRLAATTMWKIKRNARTEGG